MALHKSVLAAAAAVEQMTKEAPPASFGTWRPVAEDFEKDDDTNHHMDFVTAASNIRATNYDIPWSQNIM